MLCTFVAGFSTACTNFVSTDAFHISIDSDFWKHSTKKQKDKYRKKTKKIFHQTKKERNKIKKVIERIATRYYGPRTY
jgi:hypothetical protein